MDLVGGVDSQGSYISKILYVKTKESRPLAVADPGGVPPAHAPLRVQILLFDIQIFRNVATSGVGAPHEVGAPLWEILDPPLLRGRHVLGTPP